MRETAGRGIDIRSAMASSIAFKNACLDSAWNLVAVKIHIVGKQSILVARRLLRNGTTFHRRSCPLYIAVLSRTGPGYLILNVKKRVSSSWRHLRKPAAALRVKGDSVLSLICEYSHYNR